MRGCWAEALRVNQQALHAAQPNSQSNTAAFAHNLAVMYHYLGEIDKSQELYKESLEIERKFGNQRGVAVSLNLRRPPNIEGN
jgi:tetratricopeptide (TPR) repeat protein